MQQIANIALSISGISFVLLIITLGVNMLFHPEESRLSPDEIYQERIRQGEE